MADEELSEELLTEALGLEAEEPKQEEEHQPTELEVEAEAMGWTDKETFVAKGGDPEKHVSPHEYVRYGKLQDSTNSRIASLERKFEDRLTNLNRLHEAQQVSKIKDLQAQQRQAVDDADTARYDAIQGQIESVAAETVPQTVTKDPAIVEWEASNPWINNPSDPKTVDAQGLWNSFAAQNPNATTAMALAHVDAKMEKLYPTEKPTNSRRNQPSANETSTPARRGKSRELSMNDLSHDERQEYANVGHMFPGKDGKPSQKVFLKAVQDARKA